MTTKNGHTAKKKKRRRKLRQKAPLLTIAMSSLRNADIQDCEGSVDYFELFFSDQLLNPIVRETNKYGSQKTREWNNTTIDEVRQFIDICLYMGSRTTAKSSRLLVHGSNVLQSCRNKDDDQRTI